MTKEEYSEYLQSDHWQTVREERLEYDHHQCVFCGTTNDLQVHHITYDRLGSEDVPHDLVTLCRTCHFKLHEILERESVFIAQEHDKFSSEFRNCFKKFVNAFREEIRNAEIEHERRINRKAGQIMYELLGGRTPGCTATAEKVLKESLEKFDGMTFYLRPAYHPNIPSPGTLYRVLRGKKKDGVAINTVREWEAAYDKLEKDADGKPP